MRIEKFDGTEVMRIPMARGYYEDGKVFVLSLITDGSGLVLEFEDEEGYFLPTQELVSEVLKQRNKK